MINNDIQDLLKAIRLPSAELTAEALKKLLSINATAPTGTGILHFFIEIYKSEHLRLEDFKKLIELGANVNAQNSEGQTPLHYTALSPYSIDLARVLIENNAIIDIVNNTGNTPLRNAIMNYQGEEELIQIILLLLNNGADLDKPNNHGVSPKDLVLDIHENVLDGIVEKEIDIIEHISSYLK